MAQIESARVFVTLNKGFFEKIKIKVVLEHCVRKNYPQIVSEEIL